MPCSNVVAWFCFRERKKSLDNVVYFWVLQHL
jgi:hypothetical protein